jgi:glycine/D-amino acid oxidase-like deaminating enzyme
MGPSGGARSSGVSGPKEHGLQDHQLRGSHLRLTRKRDLRGGTAVWAAYHTARIQGARLRRSTRSDVVIVGAGVSGALIAHSLTEAGLRPLILDRRREALLGSTAASTALLQFELDIPLTQLSRLLGPRTAAHVWRASRDAVNELRTRTYRLGIKADFETRPSLYLAGNVLDAAGLKREAAQRRRIGLPSEFLSRRELRHHFGIDRSAALLSHGNAEANPIELAAGYLGTALKGGARFHAPHEIVDLHAHRRGTTLVTDDGLEIQATHVVLCTGYELARIVPPRGNRVLSTWAIATRPQPQAIWPQKALIWEASDPYLYLRSTADGRVICGGEDAEVPSAEIRDGLTTIKAKRLEKKLHRLFPAIDPRAAFSWTGSFGSNSKGMPTIAEIPGYPKCYVVMGYGGNGITFSMLASQILTAAILGKTSENARLFRFR